MSIVTNISAVTDYTGSPPTTVYSNPVTTEIREDPQPPVCRCYCRCCYCPCCGNYRCKKYCCFRSAQYSENNSCE